ncbi:LamG-like jellyroll fold domain-containing protein [Micromonospora sp. NPDC047707]|uniref:LamG-like jellyroll fold domain-containing protein n=1 Tax=Micromonospora sp. NPDC047707 TaxID=3154498 RepID=UPI003456D233
MLTWPAPLPRPVLTGDTATYPEVLPGVDLRVQAKPQGFSHVLSVKNPRAAKNPALARVRFGLRGDGLSVRTEPSGALIAVDKRGELMFRAPPPRMWDSGPTATAAGTPARREAVLPVRLTAGVLTLTPDQKLLRDPATRFPVEIDPDWHAGRSAWALVYGTPDSHRSQSYWFGDGDNAAKVGFSDWNRPSVLARSYFQFDVGFLHGKQILGAELNVRETYAPSCEPREVELYHTDPISPSTTWNSQPGQWYTDVRNVAFGYDARCLPSWLGFAVGGQVAGSVGGGSPTVTFMLRARNEADRYAWKKFDPNDLSLIVHFNHIPYQPSNPSAEPKPGCSWEPNEPYISTATPTLMATIADPDGGRVSGHFEWYVRHGPLVGHQRTVLQQSGSEFRLRVPDGHFGDGSKIIWRVRGIDDLDAAGPWSDWCDLTVDLTPPNRPPLVSSDTFPELGEGGAPGKTGQFTFNANGVPDVVEFAYRLTGQAEQRVPATNGSATVSITPPTADPYTLEVTSVDRAGNRGNTLNTKKYDFRVGLPTPPVAYWPIDGHTTSTSVPDVAGSGHHGTFVTGTASWTTGRVGDGLWFDAAKQASVSTSGSTIRTDSSFSVAAWVRLDAADGLPRRTIVSQDGVQVSSFLLQYIGGTTKRWSFSMPVSDSRDVLLNQAVSDSSARVGEWTHLMGVYDAGARQIRLYVNGVLAGQASHTTPWHVGGEVRIGRAKFNGAAVDFWSGAIDEVRIYDRGLPDVKTVGATEIDKLATQPANEEAVWTLDEGTGAVTVDASGNYRRATVGAGASWVTGRVGAGAVRMNGSGGYVEAPPPTGVITTQSFTVTAWVRAESLGTVHRTAVSKDGSGHSGFLLGYRPDSGRWSFMMPKDAAGSASYVVADLNPPATGQWTHLAGVYDASVPEIRLYVDGVQAGAATALPTPLDWNAGGALQLGRAQWGGNRVDFWHGSIDEVHLYQGVRTADQIRDEVGHPVADRTPSRALGRYVGHTGDRFTANGPVPRGYHLEGPLGWLLPPGTPGTRLIYACQMTAADEFTSVHADCEGRPVLAALGAVYTRPPADVPTLAIYRCATSAGERFDAILAHCAGYVNEGLLGHTLAYGGLRYGRRGSGPAIDQP